MNPFEWDQELIGCNPQVPLEPGCYALLIPNKEILYIGRSKLLANRVGNPKRHKGFMRSNEYLESLLIAWKIGWNIYDKEQELINKYKPRLCVNRWNCQAG